jgi:hypothetical protein
LCIFPLISDKIDLYLNQEKLKVTIQPNEIQAIHRIRGKEGQAPPVIVKLINTEVKSRVMNI